eukprot:XP_006509592.2 PREDICTED: uncharacterized protein LOC102639847 [Mus musculus]
MRESENGANTPEPNDVPHEVATLEKDVLGTEALVKGRPRTPGTTGIPTLRALPRLGPHSPRPRGVEKLTSVAPTRVHPRTPRRLPGQPQAPPRKARHRRRQEAPLAAPDARGARSSPRSKCPKVPRFRAPEAPRTPSQTEMRARILGPRELGLSEKSLGHRGCDLLVPEVLHVLRFEICEDLVPDVVSGELPGLGGNRGRGLNRPGLLLCGAVGRAQDDGQRVRRDLQKLLHLNQASVAQTALTGAASAGCWKEPAPDSGCGESESCLTLGAGGPHPSPPVLPRGSPGAPRRSPREGAAGRLAVVPGRDTDAEPAAPRGPAPVTCSPRPPSGHSSFSSRGTLAFLGSPQLQRGRRAGGKGAEGAGSSPRSGEFPRRDPA